MKSKFHIRKKNLHWENGAAWEQVIEGWEIGILGVFPCLAAENHSWLDLVLVTVLL